MQTILTYLTLLCSGLFLQAQTNTISVTIDDIKNDDGVVLIGVYDNETKFLSKYMVGEVAEINDGKVIATFENIPDGTYAVSAIHDENEDGKLNMTLGMFPKESYGCSNGATGFFGPPKWKDAKFEISNGSTQAVTIKF